VERLGLAQVSDPAAVEGLVREVLADHAPQVAQLKSGNEKLRGFLVGRIMKAGQGKFDPQRVNEALDAVLAEASHD
jgi:aspartyl-tRNA(Asn)/glutamyl-tRNA(Gln) amidotransferase subunit B